MGLQLPTSTGDGRISSINRMSTQIQLKMRWNGVSFGGRTHLFKKTVWNWKFRASTNRKSPVSTQFFWCVFVLFLNLFRWRWMDNGTKILIWPWWSPFLPREKFARNRDFAVSLKDNNSRFSMVILPRSLFSPVVYHRPLTCLRWCWTQVRSVAGGLQGGDWMPQKEKQLKRHQEIQFGGTCDLTCTWCFLHENQYKYIYMDIWI